MALDFPASPATGATYTGPNGVIWSWDGAKWLAGTSANVYAPLTDPFFQGNPQAPNPAVGDADQTVATTKFVTDAVATSLHDVGRNYIHNSMFNIWQRGPGPFTTTTSAYTTDRWIFVNSAGIGSFTVTRATLSDGDRAAIGDEAARYCMQNNFTGNAGTTAHDYADHRIEDVRRLAGKTVIVSFWAMSSGGGVKLGLNMFQLFGSGGSPSPFVQVQVTGTAITTTASWARYSTVFTIPSIAGKTLGTDGSDATWLRFSYTCGATNNQSTGNIGVQSGIVNVWGVQLELGTVATPLEKLDPVTQLQQCQRFYCRTEIHALGTAGGASYYLGVNGVFPVTMRAVPTSVTSIQNIGADMNVAGFAIDSLHVGGFRAFASSSAASQIQYDRLIAASADL
jgi:hypothetical protein